MKRNKVIPAVFLILENSKKVLLLERFNTGWNDGMLTLPSGHVELGESPQQAIIREAFEEVGIRVDVSNLELKTTLYRKISKDEERVDFIFRTDRWEGNIVNNEPSKASKVVWVDKDKMPQNTIDFIRQIIISNVNYLELGYLLERV